MDNVKLKTFFDFFNIIIPPLLQIHYINSILNKLSSHYKIIIIKTLRQLNTSLALNEANTIKPNLNYYKLDKSSKTD